MVLAKRSGQIFTVNADIELIPSPCKGALENLIGTVRAELHIVSSLRYGCGNCPHYQSP
jgi:hypothetical protein